METDILIKLRNTDSNIPIWRITFAILFIKYFLYVVPLCEIFHE
jgi:hypothetical protein